MEQNNGEQTTVEQNNEVSPKPEQPAAKRKPLFVYLGILIAALVILIFVAFFLHNAKKAPSTQNTQSQAKPTVTPAMSYAKWTRINLDTFSIEAPLGSDNTLNTFDDGSGYMVIIVPPKSPNYPNEPIFDVEAYNSAQDLAQKQQLYLAEGAKKATLTVNSMQLPELQGSYKMRMINSQPVYTPTQLRLAYLVLPHTFYVFRMYYSSSTSVPADEDLYKQFISSFLLNK